MSYVTDLLRWVAGLLVTIIVALLGVTSAVVADAPSAEAGAYSYDGHHWSSVLDGAAERGPPLTCAPRTASNAVDDPSNGAAVSPRTATTPAGFAYDHTASLVRVASMTTAADGPQQVTRGSLSSSAGSDVAAKYGDEALAGVDDILGGLSKGRSGGVRTVGSDANLDDVYGTLTRGGSP
ncbi:MAG: hypothetical protein ACRD0P_18005, partial [Stackebrandtia sp.]